MLFGLSFIVFLVLFLLPGDVTSAMFSRPESISTSQKEQILINLGLDKGFFTQYFLWLKSIFTFDFGHSFINGQSVGSIIVERLPNSLILLGLSYFFIMFLSLILGIISAVYKNSFVDYFINFSTFTLMCMPHFWFGLMLIIIFSVNLGLLPSSGANFLGQNGFSLKHTILPLCAIVLPHIGINIKFIRDLFVENINKEFIQASIARGLNKFDIYKLTILYISPSIVRYFGTLAGSIFGGLYVIEAVFSYPGVGELSLNSIIAKDYPVVLATLLVSGIIVVLANLIAEILSILIDKRNYEK
ncbi:nickel ABC transporter, permease protein [Campylobacter corcagiensis]|uniref:ABC transporter permease n=2 Tax=Campylobacter corcagiensis TaxID=1448857 RepID=A0A7M1LIM6_9BACT|nr:nickel ABC transporter, permease protein [Campylobacter corcagiensis]QOQ88151.1 ABC transporter permease [Campylobacter corcagiensis]